MGVMVTYVYRAKVAVLAGIVAVPLLLLLILSPRVDPAAIGEARFIRADSLATLSDRIPMWERGIDYIRDRPFFGYGYGMNKFVEFGRANTELARSIVKTRGANYHNTYIQLALDLGLVGVAGLLWFLYVVLKRGLVVYNHASRGSIQLAGMAFFAAFMALFGDSFVHGWMFSPGSSMSIVFWLVSACVIRVHLLTIESETGEEAESIPAAKEPVPVA
jgi:O-antigen ligase